jgi:drug/metabolite transporter (DMT)-like permease
MPAATPLPTRALWLLALLTLVWGTNWPLFVYAVQEVSVWTFRAFALLAAGSTLLAVARWRGLSLAVPRGDWPTLLWASLAYLVVWNVASAYAAVMLPSGQAAILGFTMPLWVALIAWAAWGQRPSRRVGMALLLGATAVGLLLWRTLPAGAQVPAGFALGLLAGIGWATGTLILKRRPLSMPLVAATGWQLVLAGVPIALVALATGEGLREGRWFIPSWSSLIAIAYITWVPMTVGNLAWFAIVGLLPAQIAGLSSVLVPVVAMISGALLRGEPLGPVEAAAMACSAVALWLSLGSRASADRASGAAQR